ncbi:hypothetical protein [Psychrobacillus sp.]|uniref:hypothetical protein n=1 Tax=Psychrobacillus sp. TaxID=1871623 RepID=UPI0028BD7C30|nr:hypothetical protein [Psychrobacillus sp.]
MNKSTLRSFGIGLFIAGAAFQLQSNFFDKEIKNSTTSDTAALKTSQEELTNVKQQLAQLQLDLENAKKVPVLDKEEKPKDESTDVDTKSILIIEPGMNSIDIGSTLESLGVISNKQDFEDYLIAQDLAIRIQIGEYELDSSMTIKEIAEKITKNKK